MRITIAASFGLAALAAAQPPPPEYTSAAPEYACNPAHSYPGGASCVSTSGTLMLVTPTVAPIYGTGPPMMNGTLGATATGGNGTIAPGYVTSVVTAFTTYCPYATTLTYNSETYTVSSATTLTITNCPCTISSPIATPVGPTVSPTYPAGPNGTTPAPMPYTGDAAKVAYGGIVAFGAVAGLAFGL